MAALLALTVQLVLSFGHVHGLGADRADEAALVAAAGTAGTPAPTGPADRDDDYCAICAVLSLLSGAQTANPPTLDDPVACTAAEVVEAPAAAPVAFAFEAFRSRAPPMS